MVEAQCTRQFSPPVSLVSVSEGSSYRHNNLQAVRMQRNDAPRPVELSSSVSMPPWLRSEVAKRKRQLVASREIVSPISELPEVSVQSFATSSNPTGSRFSMGTVESSRAHPHYVSEWLDSLPDRLTQGRKAVHGDEMYIPLQRRRVRQGSCDDSTTTSSQCDDVVVGQDNRPQTGLEELYSEAFDYCLGAEAISEDCSLSEEGKGDDKFLFKVLLGRKRLMQAEIGVKRLKMALKHMTSGLKSHLGDAEDTQHTRELLDEIDNTFGEVVRKRLSAATIVHQQLDQDDDDQKRLYRRRLQTMRHKDPEFVLRLYNEEEIRELKMMIGDILEMDIRTGGNEGTGWFWNMLPRLLELRADMAEAELEIQRQRVEATIVSGEGNPRLRERDTFVLNSMSVWDLYFHQYTWMQDELNFRPVGSWYAFSIPIQEEVETEDWELRFEQRIWLQEHFSLSLGMKRWLPFRQSLIPMS